jgi:hypothetical protein
MSHALMFPKPVRKTDPQYIKWVRRQPCLVDHVAANAHHTTAKGAGGSDYRCVPLCPRHHNELHRIGRLTFQHKHNLDFSEEIIRLLEMYVSAISKDSE